MVDGRLLNGRMHKGIVQLNDRLEVKVKSSIFVFHETGSNVMVVRRERAEGGRITLWINAERIRGRAEQGLVVSSNIKWNIVDLEDILLSRLVDGNRNWLVLVRCRSYGPPDNSASSRCKWRLRSDTLSAERVGWSDCKENVQGMNGMNRFGIE